MEEGLELKWKIFSEKLSQTLQVLSLDGLYHKCICQPHPSSKTAAIDKNSKRCFSEQAL
jgi:hypothetical protein